MGGFFIAQIKDLMEIIKEDIDTIEIRDISICSFLYATGLVQLIGKRKLQNGDIYFQFTPKKTAEELIQQYWSSKAPPIQPKTLFSALRDIKDMIFGG